MLSKSISDPNFMKDTWDRFAESHIENPFLLSVFIKCLAEYYKAKGWAPLIVTVSYGDALVGLAPLKIQKRFGVNYAKFLSNLDLSPDLIVWERPSG